MSYCIDFFRKFKKEGNFCGLDKSQVSRLNAYMEIVELLVKQKIPEEQIYENFKVKAAEPLISAKGEAHTDGLNYVTSALKEGKRVTQKDVQATLKSCINATTKPALPVEKPKKEPYNGTPQPGDYPDPVPPPAPLAAIMKEKFSEREHPVSVQKTNLETSVRKQEMTEAAKNQPAGLPCKSGKSCPGDRNYLLKQEHLGDKCTACGSLIRNLEYCPVIQRQKAAESNAGIFTTGGQIKALVEKVPAEVPRVAENAPMELTIKFSGKQWAVLKQIVREGQADTLEEAVLFLVDEAGERMEGS